MSNKKEDLFGLNNDSEEEDVSLDEEEQEDSRFSKTRLQKQSLSDDDSEADSDADDSETEETNDDMEEKTAAEDNEEESEEEDNELDAEGYDAPKDLTAFGATKKRVRTAKKVKSLTPEELEKFEKARKKTGVCYLSRIPLFMKPSRVRSLLEKHGEIGRIYLVPEGNFYPYHVCDLKRLTIKCRCKGDSTS